MQYHVREYSWVKEAKAVNRMTKRLQSRRDLLVGATNVAAFAASGAVALSGMSRLATARTAGARAAADGAGLIPYGAAVQSDLLTSDQAYREAVIANCQVIVPEGEMKWPILRPTRDKYLFEKADTMVDFARQNGLGLRGHTLVWYAGMPEWTNAIASRAEAERELVDHIETIMFRYRGAVPSWDVVNEPLVDWPDDASSLRQFVWTKWLGADYIAIALRTAAAADPDAQLVVNEYDIEFRGPRYAAKRRAFLQLLRSLRDKGVPLHAVGLQAHLFADRAIDRDGMQAFLAEIAALKLDVLITELDVIDYELPSNVGERDALVAGVATRFLETVCEVVRPRAILTWGLTDRYTWVPIYFKRKDGTPNRPLPFDANYKPKPLFDVIEQFRRKSA